MCNQLLLEKDSCQYLIINALRFVLLASAPAIFQKTIDSILRGLKGVLFYIDDILITGGSETEHLKNFARKFF